METRQNNNNLYRLIALLVILMGVIFLVSCGSVGKDKPVYTYEYMFSQWTPLPNMLGYPCAISPTKGTITQYAEDSVIFNLEIIGGSIKDTLLIIGDGPVIEGDTTKAVESKIYGWKGLIGQGDDYMYVGIKNRGTYLFTDDTSKFIECN